MSRAARDAAVVILIALGCGHRHTDWPPPHATTDLGTPLWDADPGGDIDRAGAACDAAQVILELAGEPVPRGRCVLYAAGDRPYSGRAHVRGWHCRRHIEVAVHPERGPLAYAHERLHEAGWPDGHDPWPSGLEAEAVGACQQAWRAWGEP